MEGTPGYFPSTSVADKIFCVSRMTISVSTLDNATLVHYSILSFPSRLNSMRCLSIEICIQRPPALTPSAGPFIAVVCMYTARNSEYYGYEFQSGGRGKRCCCVDVWLRVLGQIKIYPRHAVRRKRNKHGSSWGSPSLSTLMPQHTVRSNKLIGISCTQSLFC